MSYTLMFSQITRYIPLLLGGLGLSVVIAVIGMLVGSVLGILVAVAKKSPFKLLQLLVDVYIEVFRNTPLLIQMYLFYFGLGQFQLHISAMNAALLALILNNGAYTGVIFQTGLDAVNKGARGQCFRYDIPADLSVHPNTPGVSDCHTSLNEPVHQLVFVFIGGVNHLRP